MNNPSWTTSLNKDRASGIVINGNKILLIHRVREDREYWVLPGGGVEKNEAVEDALDRELAEELCVIVKDKRFLFKIENANRYEYHFLILKYEGEPKLGGPEKEKMNEQNQYLLEWVELDDIKKIKNLYPQEAINKLTEYLKINGE